MDDIDLSSIAQQMAAFTAEELKTEANGAPRKVYIKQPTFTKMSKDDVLKGFTLLGGFSVRLNDRKKRLWLSLISRSKNLVSLAMEQWHQPGRRAVSLLGVHYRPCVNSTPSPAIRSRTSRAA
jgi:hypothetical protein